MSEHMQERRERVSANCWNWKEAVIYHGFVDNDEVLGKSLSWVITTTQQDIDDIKTIEIKRGSYSIFLWFLS